MLDNYIYYICKGQGTRNKSNNIKIDLFFKNLTWYVYEVKNMINIVKQQQTTCDDDLVINQYDHYLDPTPEEIEVNIEIAKLLNKIDQDVLTLLH